MSWRGHGRARLLGDELFCGACGLWFNPRCPHPILAFRYIRNHTHDPGQLPPSLSYPLPHNASIHPHPPTRRYIYDHMDDLGELAEASIRDVGFIRGSVISV